MNHSQPTVEQIRERANQLYWERGGEPGHELDDWLQAEYELMQLPIRKIAELEPPKAAKNKRFKKTLVAVVQAALILGAEALPHLNR